MAVARGTSNCGTLSGMTSRNATVCSSPRNERTLCSTSLRLISASRTLVSSFRRFISSCSISFSVMVPILYRPCAML